MTFTICPKRRAVLDERGHCLVMGGPGSGKTTLALMKASARITAGLQPGQGVLFLSFSRAAVARILDVSGDCVPKEQRRSLSIQTFHSFFWQILGGYGYLLGAPRRLSIVLAHDEKAARDGIEADSPVWPEWEAARLRMFHEQGRVCFDLFAPLAAALLERAASIRDRVARRYPLVLVDEAQDTGDSQWTCVKSLAAKSQIVCLADPDQMIYDFLPGVGPARIGEIRAALKPLEVDFGHENNRSPGTEIAAFARDVLHGYARGSRYEGVSRQRFNASVDRRTTGIRSSIGILRRRIEEQTGAPARSIAVIASYTSGVAIISSALQRDKPIPHRVLFDEAFALLASRAAAFLLEPKHAARATDDTATLLELAGAAFRAKGTKTGRELSTRWSGYASRCRAGAVPAFKAVTCSSSLVAWSSGMKFSGDPRRDWVSVKARIRETGESSWVDLASSLDYLVAFARGNRIAEDLSAVWMQHGTYAGARDVLDSALAQVQLLSASEETSGIHVMNMHKCKGKQFDGVVLYRQQHHSPFVWRSEVAPHAASRRYLHMAITRARFHVLILDEAGSTCPIIGPHTL